MDKNKRKWEKMLYIDKVDEKEKVIKMKKIFVIE